MRVSSLVFQNSSELPNEPISFTDLTIDKSFSHYHRVISSNPVESLDQAEESPHTHVNGIGEMGVGLRLEENLLDVGVELGPSFFRVNVVQNLLESSNWTRLSKEQRLDV